MGAAVKYRERSAALSGENNHLHLCCQTSSIAATGEKGGEAEIKLRFRSYFGVYVCRGEVEPVDSAKGGYCLSNGCRLHKYRRFSCTQTATVRMTGVTTSAIPLPLTAEKESKHKNKLHVKKLRVACAEEHGAQTLKRG